MIFQIFSRISKDFQGFCALENENSLDFCWFLAYIFSKSLKKSEKSCLSWKIETSLYRDPPDDAWAGRLCPGDWKFNMKKILKKNCIFGETYSKCMVFHWKPMISNGFLDRSSLGSRDCKWVRWCGYCSHMTLWCRSFVLQQTNPSHLFARMPNDFNTRPGRMQGFEPPRFFNGF